MNRRLQPGDRVGIAALSSPFDRKLFEKGCRTLNELGWKPVYDEGIFEAEGYLAGPDRRRKEAFFSLMEDPGIKAVFFARGGYGSQRILPGLDPKVLRKHAKPLIGFSDLTSLLIHLNEKAGCPALYGPVLTQLGKDPDRETLRLLKAWLTDNVPPAYSLTPCRILSDGRASGKITGGCLKLISTAMGTPYEIDTEGKILFFEDANEKVYALDRMITQLKNAGKLRSVKGILVGSLEPVAGEKHSVEAMLTDCLKDFEGPIVTGFPSGHCHPFFPVPLGIAAVLDTGRRELVFKESFL